jgi:hypothetical protein
MDVKIPKTFLDNLNIVVKYQNIRLISDICKYMKWNNSIKNMLIKDLVN